MPNGPNGQEERRAITGIALRWAHLIIAVVLYLLSLGALYATMREQIAENTRDIERNRQDSVTKERFDDLKEDVTRRLQRIENKLDQDIAIRNLN